MEFMIGPHRSPKGINALWVTVDLLTKSAYFITFRFGQSTEILPHNYMQEVVIMHGVPAEIISNRDTRFKLHYWNSLYEASGTKLCMSLVFQPQTDCQSK